MEMNKLASDTSLEIQEQLKNIASKDLYKDYLFLSFVFAMRAKRKKE
jgi:hypothetical protein